MKRTVLALSSMLALLGCDEQLSVRQVCEETPQFCNDLNTDSHCNAQRSEVIIGRYIENKTPTDKVRYQLLTDFHQYSQCVELASSIEHIKLKEKTTSRVNGYLTSIKEIKRLSDATKNSRLPELLYYHWAHNNDQSAIAKLEALDKEYKLENSDMQFKLASYYTKFDLDLAIDKLYHALELNPDGDIPNPEIYTALVDTFFKLDKIKQSYIWAIVAIESDVKNIDLAPLEYKLEKDGRSLDKLQSLAYATKDQIESGQFKSPRQRKDF